MDARQSRRACVVAAIATVIVTMSGGAAIAADNSGPLVIDPASLRWVGFSHVEADECGALNDWLVVAPNARPVCSQVAAMTSGDMADRPPRPLADLEELPLGAARRVRCLDAPHLPHNWECGYLFEASTRTLLCGDLFTHGGADVPPLTSINVQSRGDGPFDAQAIGETGVVPTPAAIANAVADAIGVPVTHLPLSAERVLNLIDQKK